MAQFILVGLEQIATRSMLKADDNPPFSAAGLSSSRSTTSMQKQFALEVDEYEDCAVAIMHADEADVVVILPDDQL
jgi:hypothetical protein